MRRGKPSRRDVRAQKKREEEELQTLTRRVHDDAPPPGSVTCPARNFVDLPISRATLQGLKNGGFTRMTEVQRTAIPHALAERRVVGMIDFQLSMVQPVGADISWFCTSSFTVEDCKKNADELVRN